MSNLLHTVRDYNSSISKKMSRYSGLLGFAIGGTQKVNVPNRAGYVYVRLRDSLSEVIQARNSEISPVYGFPVIVERLGNGWKVVGKDEERYDTFGTSAPFLPQHGDQHSFNRDGGGGGDPVAVYPDQFMPLLVYPSGTAGSSGLLIAPHLLQREADFIYAGNTGTINLIQYKPSNSSAIMGLVCLNKISGNPEVLIASGTPLSSSITGTSGVSPYIPYPGENQVALAAFRLLSGTSSLTWDNLYNARQFFGRSTSITGSTGGGISGIVAWEGGIVRGTGTVLNFTGDFIDVSVSGTVVNIFVTGSSGAGTPGGSNTQIQYNNAGAFGASSDFAYDDIGKVLYLGDTSADRTSIHRFGFAAAGNATHSLYTWGSGLVSKLSATFHRGTSASPTATQNADDMLWLQAAGWDGVDANNSSARIKMTAAENFDTTHHGTNVEVYATPTGSTTLTKILTFLGSGHVDIATGKEYRVNGAQHVHGITDITDRFFLFPFATYVSGNPLTADAYPYGGTYGQPIDLLDWQQGMFLVSANSSSNYWTVNLYLRPSNSGYSKTLLASFDTKTYTTANNAYHNSTTTFSQNLTGTGYLFIECLKTGTPGDMYIVCPSLKCR